MGVAVSQHHIAIDVVLSDPALVGIRRLIDNIAVFPVFHSGIKIERTIVVEILGLAGSVVKNSYCLCRINTV